MLEADGLMRRFGAPTAEAAALLEGLALLRLQLAESGRDGDLRLSLLMPDDFADEDVAALVECFPSVDGMPLIYASLTCDELWRLSTQADARRRLMLLAGRFALAEEARDRGVVAFLARDCRDARLGFLYLPETLRVVAEALRLATPRPMSDEARRGTLVAFPILSAPPDWPLALARLDGRADWIGCGADVIVYSEAADRLEEVLGTTPLHVVSPSVSLGELRFRRGGPADLATCGNWALSDAGPHGLRWSELRRSRLPGMSKVAYTEPVFTAAMRDSLPEGQGEIVCASGPRDPFVPLVLLVWRGGSADLATRLAAIAGIHTVPAVLLAHVVTARVAVSPDLDAVLWQGEANRVVSTVEVEVVAGVFSPQPGGFAGMRGLSGWRVGGDGDLTETVQRLVDAILTDLPQDSPPIASLAHP